MDFTVRARVEDSLWKLEQQADAIGRRVVRIDSLPGASARPSVVAAVLNAIDARDAGPGEPKSWRSAAALSQQDPTE
eukprot:6317344-Lingulodinium_polyedra.AAC.1